MKTGKVFGKLEADAKVKSITFNTDGEKTVSATVALVSGWLNDGKGTKDCATAHEARLFIEGAVDSTGWNGRTRRKGATKPAAEAPADEATGTVLTGKHPLAVLAGRTEYTLPQGFYNSLATPVGDVIKSNSKKVTVALTAEERLVLVKTTEAAIADEATSIGLKGSARATLAALAA